MNCTQLTASERDVTSCQQITEWRKGDNLLIHQGWWMETAPVLSSNYTLTLHFSRQEKKPSKHTETKTAIILVTVALEPYMLKVDKQHLAPKGKYTTTAATNENGQVGCVCDVLNNCITRHKDSWLKAQIWMLYNTFTPSKMSTTHWQWNSPIISQNSLVWCSMSFDTSTSLRVVSFSEALHSTDHLTAVVGTWRKNPRVCFLTCLSESQSCVRSL